jgi:tripartite-type tricarboxylate transporter receptor subunit TctC
MPVHYAAAQNFPERPVRMVVPFAPGGASDFVARLLAKDMAKELGQPVLVDNKPGAAGMVGLSAAAASPADGYTMLLGNIGTMAINPKLMADHPMANWEQHLNPLIKVIDATEGLVVGKNVSAKSVSELLELVRAKNQPKPMTFATTGAGSLARLQMELLKRASGISMVDVPYKGGGPALSDIAAGHVEMMFTPISSITGFVQSGHMRLLAVTSEERLPEFPGIPTFKELGYGELVTSSWQGLYVPAGTPAAASRKLHAAAAAALSQKSLQKTFADAGMTVSPAADSQAFGAFSKKEANRWGDLISKLGIKLN